MIKSTRLIESIWSSDELRPFRQCPEQWQQKILQGPVAQHDIALSQWVPSWQWCETPHRSQHLLFAEPTRIKSKPKFKSIKFFILKISKEKLVLLMIMVKSSCELNASLLEPAPYIREFIWTCGRNSPFKYVLSTQEKSSSHMVY